MKKKLHSLFAISFLLVGFLMLNSCTEKKYYQDSSANWETIIVSVKKNMWEWNSNLQRYEYILNISSDDIIIDDFIYEDGLVIPYLLLGKPNQGETQHLISGGSYIPSQKGVFGCDTSISRDNDDLFTVRFYYYWDNPNDFGREDFTFRLLLLWGNAIYK